MAERKSNPKIVSEARRIWNNPTFKGIANRGVIVRGEVVEVSNNDSVGIREVEKLLTTPVQRPEDEKKDRKRLSQGLLVPTVASPGDVQQVCERGESLIAAYIQRMTGNGARVRVVA